MSKKKDGWWKISVGVLLICIITLGIMLFYNIQNKFFYNDLNREIATIDIRLKDVSLEDIKAGSKETKYEDNELVLSNNNQTISYSNLQIEGRGNTTWSYDKRSYQIKFKDKTDLLGMGKARKWVLISNYIDPTSMRSDIAFTIAEMIGEEYSTRGEFVNLYFDGEYEGLYYLLHKIEIDKNSVDIKSDDGVIFELDNIHSEDEIIHESYFGDYLVMKDMVSIDDRNKNEIINQFLNDYTEFEKALEKKDYVKVDKIIDIDSFAKYYLINDFTNNPDAYSSSFYLYKNDDGKICAGPVWDFDFAFGNKEWVWRVDDEFLSPVGSDKNISSRMIRYLINMPGFKERVKELFKQKMANNENVLMNKIKERVKRIKDDILINNEKWEIGNFEIKYEELLDWIEKRYNYLEKEYSNETNDFIDQKRFQFL